MADRKAVIKNVDMTTEMQEYAVNTAAAAMDKHTVEKDMASYLKAEFDRKYNPAWHCIVGKHFGSLDCIILIQWNLQTGADLNRLITALWTRQNRQTFGSTRPSHLAGQKLRCLIFPPPSLSSDGIPRRSHSASSPLSPSRSRLPSTPSTSLVQAILQTAARLSISVFQLNRTTPSVVPPSARKLAQWVNVTSLRMKATGMRRSYRIRQLSKYTRAAELVVSPGSRGGLTLYEKFGVGSLEMVPVFEPRGAGTYRFDALFAWDPPTQKNGFLTSKSPVRTDINQAKTSNPHAKYILCCTHQEVASPESKPRLIAPNWSRSCTMAPPFVTDENRHNSRNTTERFSKAERDSTQHVHWLIRRLVDSSSMKSRRTSPGLSLEKRLQMRSGLTQSQTFTAGLDRAAPRGEDRLKPTLDGFHARDEANSRKAVLAKMRSWSSVDEKSSQTVGCNSDSDAFRDAAQCKNSDSITRGTQSEMGKTSKLSEMQLTNQKRPQTLSVRQVDDKRREASDRGGALGENNFKSGDVENMGSSMMPSNLNPTGNKATMGTVMTDITDWYPIATSPLGSAPYSATVLLAIPEVGEADYYSESPQYLTAADLRELGLYDDDDDDDDDEHEDEDDNVSVDHDAEELNKDILLTRQAPFPNCMTQSDLEIRCLRSHSFTRVSSLHSMRLKVTDDIVVSTPKPLLTSTTTL